MGDTDFDPNGKNILQQEMQWFVTRNFWIAISHGNGKNCPFDDVLLFFNIHNVLLFSFNILFLMMYTWPNVRSILTPFRPDTFATWGDWPWCEGLSESHAQHHNFGVCFGLLEHSASASRNFFKKQLRLFQEICCSPCFSPNIFHQKSTTEQPPCLTLFFLGCLWWVVERLSDSKSVLAVSLGCWLYTNWPVDYVGSSERRLRFF